MEEKKRLKVTVEFIETPDEAERMKKVAKILAGGVYSYLKKEGVLRIDPKRKEKVQKAMDKAREIMNRETTE
jgi:hypothetical protein